jgi:hypothetical protein
MGEIPLTKSESRRIRRNHLHRQWLDTYERLVHFMEKHSRLLRLHSPAISIPTHAFLIALTIL